MGKHLLIIPFIPTQSNRARSFWSINRLSQCRAGKVRLEWEVFSRQKATCVRETKARSTIDFRDQHHFISRNCAEVQHRFNGIFLVCPVGQKATNWTICRCKMDCYWQNEKFTLQLFEDIDGNRKLNQNDRFVQLLILVVQSFPRWKIWICDLCSESINKVQLCVISTRQKCICRDTLAISLGGVKHLEKILFVKDNDTGVSPSASTSYQWRTGTPDTCSFYQLDRPRINGDTLAELLTLTEFICVVSCTETLSNLNVNTIFRERNINCPGELSCSNAVVHIPNRIGQDWRCFKVGIPKCAVGWTKHGYLDFWRCCFMYRYRYIQRG